MNDIFSIALFVVAWVFFARDSVSQLFLKILHEHVQNEFRMTKKGFFANGKMLVLPFTNGDLKDVHFKRSSPFERRDQTSTLIGSEK